MQSRVANVQDETVVRKGIKNGRSAVKQRQRGIADREEVAFCSATEREEVFRFKE